MAIAHLQREPTPRPSISPLSNVSIPNESFQTLDGDGLRDYEKAQDNSNMHNVNVAEDDDELDDGSSSLSEPDDDNDGLEQHDNMSDGIPHAAQLSAQTSLEVDSEAETERIDQTPQKRRRYPESLGRTPSKLSQAETAEDELSEPPSPLRPEAGAASSTSTVALTGHKRKHSSTAESSLSSAEDSDLDEPPRKIGHIDVITNADDRPDAADSPVDRAEAEVKATEIPDEALPEQGITVPVKATKGKRGRHKWKAEKELAQNTPDAQDQTDQLPEEPTAEELQRRKEASATYADVTLQFRAFSEKLINERLLSLQSELQLLGQGLHKDQWHPELLRQIACIDQKLNKEKGEIQAFHDYKLQARKQRVLAERSQTYAQYYQYVRDLREDTLYKIGEDWYGIQKERRESHQEDDEKYLYNYPVKRSVQVRQQAKYNQEVSVLSGIAKYVGFPAAPEINGTDARDLDSDLRAMKLSKRVTAPHHAARPVAYLPTSASAGLVQDERSAHDRFIEQNAWARPQAPIHSHGTTSISHTPDWHGATKRVVRNLTGQSMHQISSPFATPVPQQKQRSLEHPSSGIETVGVNSDGITAFDDPPSSILAAPPTLDRDRSSFQFQHGVDGGSSQHTSPVTTTTLPKQRQHGSSSTAMNNLTGFRNFSNVSGTSTIDAPQGGQTNLGIDREREREREVERERERERISNTNVHASNTNKTFLPALLLTQPSSSSNGNGSANNNAHPFETNDSRQRHGRDYGGAGGGEKYAIASDAGSFRPREATFGTAAPAAAGAFRTGLG